MVVLAGGDEVTVADLPPEIVVPAQANGDSFLLDLPEKGISLEAVERELLMLALVKFNWNQTQAAHQPAQAHLPQWRSTAGPRKAK